MEIDRIGIVGLGLIGGSIGLELQNKGYEVYGLVNKSKTAERAKERGLAQTISTNPNILSNCSMVILAIPLEQLINPTSELVHALPENAVITDVGSVKKHLIDSLLPILPSDVYFVPGHPIAGTEKSGPEAGFAELFNGRWCILTPNKNTSQVALEKVKFIWEQAGMQIATMDAEYHDRVLAITSHIPHLVAFSIVGTVTELEDQLKTEVIKYSAGGFRDFTRIAASDPIMWRDVFLNNSEAVLEMLGRFIEDLTALQKSIRWQDGDSLENLFTKTREIRKGIISEEQD